MHIAPDLDHEYFSVLGHTGLRRGHEPLAFSRMDYTQKTQNNLLTNLCPRNRVPYSNW